MRPALHARQRVSKAVSVAFPTLSNPPVLLFGDSLAAHEHQNIAMNSAVFTRDGTTNIGRITTSSNPISNSLWGTPRVQLVNLSDTTMEVQGRNNYADSGAGSTTVSIHTRQSDAVATGVPTFNPTTAASGVTQTISNGTIINLERKSHRGVAHAWNALAGGGMDIIGNLGHPGALASGMGAELAYAKQLLALYTNPVVALRLGINDIKGGATPNTTFTAAKVILDGLTGLDGNGGNAFVVLYSCTAVGSVQSGYATLNEQVIGKCATSAAPTVLNVDSTQYTVGGVLQHTYNYQLYQYALANPGKVIFVDATSCDYNFTHTCMFDATYPDAGGYPHTADGTHILTNGALLNGAQVNSATSSKISFPLIVPRSASDATTPGGHTRLLNKGPWVGTTVTTGFLTGGSASTTLPKGGTGGQPSGWACGRTSGSGTMAVSVYDGGDASTNGYWVNMECTAGAANDIVAAYPCGAGGVSPASLGVAATDTSELELVFELRWDNVHAAGVELVQAYFPTNSGGAYGLATSGEELESVGILPDVVAAGTRFIRTGRLQMSSASITAVVPQILVKFGSITGVTCNVGVRCVGIIKY